MKENLRSSQKSKTTLGDICDILQAEVICGEDKLDKEIQTACGCDLMSDVLAFTSPGSALLTGLTNQQVIRTAEMLDLKAVIFVRNKRPDEETIALAKAGGLPILTTPHPLYESCGMLYAQGLSGCDGASRKRDKPAARKIYAANGATPEACAAGE